jgi:Lrp/AsnC family transcriptional regulator, leucine-responsive regulatory protein
LLAGFIFMKTTFEADGINWKILELLQRDARMTHTDIGKVVSLTQPAMTARIRALEEAGVM